MKILDIPQQSPEWFAERAGLPTASQFDKIVTSKGDRSKMADKYMLQLAGEKVLGTMEATYQNDAMKRGVALEPEARLCYEVMTGNSVEQVGFCVDERGWGCSPDGLIGVDGGIEIKAPTLTTHVSYLLLEGDMPTEYLQQVQGCMFVTGRKWWDFVSYYPGLRTLVVRVERDEAFISKLEAELKVFVKELANIVEKIK